MTEIGNKNMISARLDPARLKLVERLKRCNEGDSEFVRRAIDSLGKECLGTEGMKKYGL
jgi:hypothetical protein